MSASSPGGGHILESVEAFDLSRHALIEASAGTGKTFTIEHLVIRLIKEEPELNLENILLVTFTEKATGELKTRIRQKIEQTLDDDHTLGRDVRQKLVDALNDYDNAAIFTIHGFCHTLLSEFPFETGSPFQQEVIDDPPLLERLLKDRMQSDWPRRYGPRLAALLDSAGFADNPDRFMQRVIDLAQRLTFDRNDETVNPDPDRLDLDALWQSGREAVRDLQQRVPDPATLIAAYQRLNINKRTKAAVVRDLLTPLQQALAQLATDDDWLGILKPLVAVCGGRHSTGVRQIDRLVPDRWLKGGANLDECPQLTMVRDLLNRLVEVYAGLSHVLILSAVKQLQGDARAAKRRNGWISYQDMLERVAGFLKRPGSAAGIDRIRHRYRVAVVDEFQDTDALQWQIFKTLFLDTAERSGNRLFLIGDPKQAIYAFRGADVFTYLDARRRMIALAGTGRATIYVLNVNWRSAPALVAAFNRLFAQPCWFGADADDDPYVIGYVPSTSPPADQLPARIVQDRSQRPALNVVDLTGANSPAAARVNLAGFICREIRELVQPGRVRMIDGGRGERDFHYGDVAILVRRQSEFDDIEPQLKAWSIPYAYYRKAGLFQSREAHWLSMVLQAIIRPHRHAIVRRALLTPFFDIPAASLSAVEELPRDHAGRRLLDHWTTAAQRRRWGPLFQSIMEDSGLIYRRCTTPEWARSESNLLQMFDYLESAAYTQNLDAEGLAAHLDSLCRSTVHGGPDVDILQIEDERNKVHILTMHISKGLEFPVVFVAGGFTVRHDDAIHTYHTVNRDDGEAGYRKVVDLTAQTGREQALKEKLDEDKRLYYVSLTRSKLKLYIPYYEMSTNHRWIGPVSRLITSSIAQAGCASDDGSLGVGWHRIPTATEPPAARLSMEGGNLATDDPPRLPETDLLPVETDFRPRRAALESFSSIAHHLDAWSPDADGPGRSFTLAESSGRLRDEPVVHSLDDGAADPSPPDLPGGANMGSMFHTIFETIDFQTVAEGPVSLLDLPSARQVIDAAVSLHRIDRRWMPPIARIVADTLRAPIALHGDTLVLARLGRHQRRHELEFYFPLGRRPIPGPAVPGCRLENDCCGRVVIRGFIDMIADWQGRYYLVDWKSNRLTDGYDHASMAQEMTVAGYDLQFRLYTIAALRWLKDRLGHRFEPHRHFGGALYLFIRGVRAGAQTGVFHIPPEQLLPEDALERAVQQQIAGAYGRP